MPDLMHRRLPQIIPLHAKRAAGHAAGEDVAAVGGVVGGGVFEGGAGGGGVGYCGGEGAVAEEGGGGGVGVGVGGEVGLEVEV